MNKKNKKGPVYTQRAVITTSRENAQDILDYTYWGVGYIYWFGSYWAVYSR